MLYDGSLRFMAAAELGFQEEHFARRNEIIHNNILRAQNHLSQANREKSVEKIKVVAGFMQDIRDAWSQMLLQQSAAQAPLESNTPQGLVAKC